MRPLTTLSALFFGGCAATVNRGHPIPTTSNRYAISFHHGEFGGRVVQPDAAALDTGGHATNVAATMVAGGNLSLAAGLNIPELKGVASRANARAFNILDFNAERLNAAGGTNNTPQVFLSNHSWGLKAGWHPVQSLTLTNGTVVNGTPANPLWTWDGPLSQNFQENPFHGLYTSGQGNTNGDSCEQIDHFHHTQAPRHLMLFAAGNDRLEGPGAAVATYYTVNGSNQGTAITNSNPNYTRDWADGDEGGFDSLDAPGTAKNCLTVGACQDVFRIVNVNQVVFGFAPGVTVTNADFSGAGPTDDGRIKPDLVAVGAGNPALRQGLGYSSVISGQTVPWEMISAAANADTSASIFWSGTSAACPTVAAALGLLMERRQQLYPNLTAADALRGSTLKALAIDGVDDVEPPGPSYDGGHGLMNARTSVDRLDQDQITGRGSLVKEFSLTVGQSASWIANSVPGAILQTYTLVWSDPQGPAPALATITAPDPRNVMLVNNINIQVEHLETGTIFHPWTLNPDLTNRTAAARSAAAVRAVDQRNNVERITIATPLAGRYRITVTHAGSPAGVPATPPAPSAQVVSLVMSGTVPELPKITDLVKSAPATEWLLHFTSDPGAVYTIETSTDLQTWTNSGTVVSAAMPAGTQNSVVVTAAASPKRFWRLRRGQ